MAVKGDKFYCDKCHMFCGLIKEGEFPSPPLCDELECPAHTQLMVAHGPDVPQQPLRLPLLVMGLTFLLGGCGSNTDVTGSLLGTFTGILIIAAFLWMAIRSGKEGSRKGVKSAGVVGRIKVGRECDQCGGWIRTKRAIFCPHCGKNAKPLTIPLPSSPPGPPPPRIYGVRYLSCRSCAGTGKRGKHNWSCIVCRGEGFVPDVPDSGPVEMKVYGCPNCSAPVPEKGLCTRCRMGKGVFRI